MITPAKNDRLGRTRPINKYRSLAQVSLQQAISYRRTTLMNVLLTFVWVFVLYFLWQAAYSGRPLIQGYSWEEMRTYVVLAFGINALVGWRVGIQMMATIRTGEVLREMVRPLNYCGTQLARAAGFAVVEGILSLVLTLFVGLVLLRFEPPASPGAAALFVVSVLLGFVTKALIVFLVSLIMFWTLSGMGLMWSQEAVLQILSGTIVPLAFMPGWLRLVAEILPMRGIVSTPVTLYLGKAGGGDALLLIGFQLVWLVALWVLANLAWRKAFTVVDIQGG